jgi:hypothetical protein
MLFQPITTLTLKAQQAAACLHQHVAYLLSKLSTSIQIDKVIAFNFTLTCMMYICAIKVINLGKIDSMVDVIY